LAQAGPTQRLDRVGPEDLPDALRLVQLNGPGARVLAHAAGDLLACRGELVHLPPGARMGDVGHPFLDAAGGLQALQLEGDMGAAQREGGRDAVLRHLDRTLIGVCVTEKPREGTPPRRLLSGNFRRGRHPRDSLEELSEPLGKFAAGACTHGWTPMYSPHPTAGGCVRARLRATHRPRPTRWREARPQALARRSGLPD